MGASAARTAGSRMRAARRSAFWRRRRARNHHRRRSDAAGGARDKARRPDRDRAARARTSPSAARNGTSTLALCAPDQRSRARERQRHRTTSSPSRGHVQWRRRCARTTVELHREDQAAHTRAAPGRKTDRADGNRGLGHSGHAQANNGRRSRPLRDRHARGRKEDCCGRGREAERAQEWPSARRDRNQGRQCFRDRAARCGPRRSCD